MNQSLNMYIIMKLDAFVWYSKWTNSEEKKILERFIADLKRPCICSLFVVRLVPIHSFGYLLDQLQVIGEPWAIASHLYAIFTCFINIIIHIYMKSFIHRQSIDQFMWRNTYIIINTGHAYIIHTYIFIYIFEWITNH